MLQHGHQTKASLSHLLTQHCQHQPPSGQLRLGRKASLAVGASKELLSALAVRDGGGVEEVEGLLPGQSSPV